MERQWEGGDSRNLLPTEKVLLARNVRKGLEDLALLSDQEPEIRDGVTIVSEVSVDPMMFALAFEIDSNVEEILEAELTLIRIPGPEGDHYRVTLSYTSNVTANGFADVNAQFGKDETWDLYEDPNIPSQITFEYLEDDMSTSETPLHRSLTAGDGFHLRTLLRSLHG